MILTWMGTAALLLEEGGTTIAFDPFPGMPYEVTGSGPVPEELRRQRSADEEAFRRAGEVFVTHGHFDHILYIPRLFAGHGCGTTVHCTRTPYLTLAGRGFPEDRLDRVEPGSVRRVGPFGLRAFSSRHCRFDRKLIVETALAPRMLAHLPNAARIGLLARAFPEGGETLLWEAACGDKRVQVMGSLNLRDDVDYPAGADVLVLPFQGRSSAPYGGPLEQEALRIIGRLRPKAVCLDHWDDSFPPLSADVPTGEIVRLSEERFGIPCRPLKKYEAVRI